MMLESFLNVLQGKPAEHIPWTADITYWINGRREEGKANPDWANEEGYLRLHQELGVMAYYWFKEFQSGKRAYDQTVDAQKQDLVDQHIFTYTTPVGQIRHEVKHVTESASWAITRHAVQTEEDLKTFIYMLEHSHLDLAVVPNWGNRRKLWAKYDSYPAIAMPRSPLPAFFVEWAGVENGVLLMLDYPDLVARAMDLMEEQEKPILDALCELKPPVVHFGDNLTSETFTGVFDQWMAPRYARRLARLHEAGIKAAVHLDGTVGGLLPKLARVGFDAVEALTPQPVGDVSLEQMRQFVEPTKTILWGGAPGAMFVPPYDWPQMQRHLETLLEAWAGRPFIVGVADQVPPNGDLQICRKITDMLKSIKPR